MIQNVVVPAGSVPTEVTQYAKLYASGVAIINTGNGDLYLGEDTNVTVFNGVLVTPTNSVVWTESPKVFAVSPTGTTVQVASNVSFNAPAAVAVNGPVEIAGDLNLAPGTIVDIGTIPAIDLAAGSSVNIQSGVVDINNVQSVVQTSSSVLTNKWTWTNATSGQSGTSDGVVIPPIGGVQGTCQITATNPNNVTYTITLYLIPSFSGQEIALLSFSYGYSTGNPRTFKAVIPAFSIPVGGYYLMIDTQYEGLIPTATVLLEAVT